jgi:hypothetical protein
VPLLALILLLALAAPSTASAQKTIDKSRHLWATVNICDTDRHPDTMGVRASMPGSGKTTERMYMRFRAQYFSVSENVWKNFTSKALDSGWQRVGSARFKARQSGWTFPRLNLRADQSYELRGVVRFEWRRGRRVVRKAVKSTTRGHRTAVSEPKGFSAATCRVGS